MRKSRLRGQNSPRGESVFYPCGPGAGGELLEKERQPPCHFKRGSSKRLSPVGFTALNRRQQEWIWGMNQPGGQGAQGSRVILVHMKTVWSPVPGWDSSCLGTAASKQSNTWLQARLGGQKKGHHPGHRPAPQSSPQDTQRVSQEDDLLGPHLLVSLETYLAWMDYKDRIATLDGVRKLISGAFIQCLGQHCPTEIKCKPPVQATYIVLNFLVAT